jgi:hypothetical protein
VKSPADISRVVLARLQRTWHLDATGSGCNWPHTIALGSYSSAELAAEFPATRERIQALREWASANDLALTDGNRRVQGTTQPIPTHVTIADVDTAARLSGKPWVDRLQRGRTRGATLANRYPGCPNVPKAVRLTDSWHEVDFVLLQTVSDWFTSNRAAGLTPRQVPVPGVHAKWLNTGRPVVELLIGRSLELLARHPARIHFTYLDPDHLAAGGRRFDSATVGDTNAVAYEPDIVIITENKDTAINFPATTQAIIVEGDGFGGSTAARFRWIVDAPLVVYWGDIDAEGFEILDGYRRDGIPAASILMDPNTRRAYAAWGTNIDKDGQPIKVRTPKPLPTLNNEERVAYAAACSGDDGLPLRIEQERIPLEEARCSVLRIAAITRSG